MSKDFVLRDAQGNFTDLQREVGKLPKPIRIEGGLAGEVSLKPPTESGTATPVVPGQTSGHQAQPDHHEHEGEKS